MRWQQTENPDPLGSLIQEELDQAFRLAVELTREAILQDLERVEERYRPLLRVIAESFFESGFGVGWARRASGVLRGSPGLGKSLVTYIAEHRVRAALTMIKLGDGRIPTGRAAAAVGLGTFPTWRRAVRATTGKLPPLVNRAPRPSLRFDQLTWHHACLGELSLDHVRVLLRRLEGLCPDALDGEAPHPRPLPRLVATKAPGRKGHLTLDETRAATRRASRAPRARLARDAKDLPAELADVLKYVSENLRLTGLGAASYRRETEVRDLSLTTKIRFFLGETLAANIERRRIETALPLVVDPRFSLTGVAAEIGLRYAALVNTFRRRTGVAPAAVRGTAAATAASAAHREAHLLWLRAETGKLTQAEARRLAGYLRGLQPEAFDNPAAGSLAVRRDVDPGQVGDVVTVLEAMPWRSGANAVLARLLRTHPELSAALWYARWVRDRLRRRGLGLAWSEWRWADRHLAALLELPRDERLHRVRRERACQSDAFLWLLVDCVTVRLFHDAEESEHFADLAVAAAEARQRWDHGSEAALRALATAFKGNALQRRSEHEAAEERLAAAVATAEGLPAVEPWILGRIYSLHASLLDRQGRHRRAGERLSAAASLFTEAGDELEHLRCDIQSCSHRYAQGRDPVPLLTRCLADLERFPFAGGLIQCAHLNRLEASIYLNDQLTGSRLVEIRAYRAAMPPASSPFIETNFLQMDGLIAALEGRHDSAMASLHRAASCFDKEGLRSYAAVTWLEYSWAALNVDRGKACRAAQAAYAQMTATGFSSHGLEKIARKIHEDARQDLLDRETLRIGILLALSPKIRPAEPSGPKAS